MALSIGVLAEINVGLGTAFGGTATGMITGPETAFRGVISGEKILPLRVILLVPAMLLMSELTFSELESLAAGQSCFPLRHEREVIVSYGPLSNENGRASCRERV